VNDPSQGFRLRDLLLGALVVFSVVYLPLSLAGPEGGCTPGGADIGYRWNATVAADLGADRVTVRNTGAAMGRYDRTAALLVRVRGDGATNSYALARDRAFRSDRGLPWPRDESRSVTGVRIAGRDLRAGDEVTVLHRSSELEPYCIRTVDERTLARTSA
jgi:hypothetical protein